MKEHKIGDKCWINQDTTFCNTGIEDAKLNKMRRIKATVIDVVNPYGTAYYHLRFEGLDPYFRCYIFTNKDLIWEE